MITRNDMLASLLTDEELAHSVPAFEPEAPRRGNVRVLTPKGFEVRIIGGVALVEAESKHGRVRYRFQIRDTPNGWRAVDAGKAEWVTPGVTAPIPTQATKAQARRLARGRLMRERGL